ncbi:MAG: amidohydrolase family protein, partial [Saprospiraceae bacterium]|nr:amidohydrolase family protein [Saprospiraceae bacterium]
MRYSVVLIIISFCLFHSCTNNVMFEDAVCVQNITIIDPIDGESSNQTLIIKDGRILKIAPSKELLLDPKNNIIDGTGKFLIPGLWDAHVHFDYLEEIAPRMLDLFFCYGITSVRDIGGRIEKVKYYKDLALEDPKNMPRVKIAGPLLDGMPNVYDGSRPQNPPLSVGLATVQDVDDMIESLVTEDVDLLKAYEMLTPDQFAKVTEKAKEKGLKVTGHVPLRMDVISASNAGMNSMEHLRNLELSCASNSVELLSQRQTLLFDGKGDTGAVLRSRIHTAQRQNAIENYDESVADKVLNVLAKNDTWQIPTLALNTARVEKPFVKSTFQESFKYLPVETEKSWKENVASFSELPLSEFNINYNRWLQDMVKNIHEHEIPIMAGTDCPIFFLTPGLSLHTELEVLVRAGLSTLEALKTATYNPAKYFNIEGELGSISEGKIADLLILNTNPLDNISNTQSVNTVIKDGKLHSREDLDRRLEALDKM